MKSHSQSLKAFGRRLSLVLVARRVVSWVTVWLFAWGVIMLAGRVSGVLTSSLMVMGLLWGFPLAGVAAFLEFRRRPDPLQIRAAYDGLNRCGGILMAEAETPMSAWYAALPEPVTPALRWQSRRSLGLLAASLLFVTVVFCLPERMTAFAGPKPLQIGKLVGELQTEVEVLKEEKILEPDNATELQKQLDRLKEQSSATDPNKTWEALDHLKEANSDLARQAAEEALSKTTSLTEAETLASALQMATESGMGEAAATRAAQDLASMLKAAKIDEGLLKGTVPAELLSKLDGLSKEDLQKLLGAIQFNKNSLGRTLTNLANLKLIDAKLLSQCKNAGQCPNPAALAGFLCNSTNGCESYCQVAAGYCRGGVTRGRGDAPMTWKEESSGEGAKFKEEALPSSSRLSDAQIVGITRAAPELSGEDVAVERGALATARSGGGAAHSQAILPRHKHTVQKFFTRDP